MRDAVRFDLAAILENVAGFISDRAHDFYVKEPISGNLASAAELKAATCTREVRGVPRTCLLFRSSQHVARGLVDALRHEDLLKDLF